MKTFREYAQDMVEAKKIPNGYYYVEVKLDSHFTYGLAQDMLWEWHQNKKTYDTVSTDENNDNFYIYSKKKDIVVDAMDYLGFNKDSFLVNKK